MDPQLGSQELDLRGLMDTNITTTKLLNGSSKLGSLDTAKATLSGLIWTKEITILRIQLGDTALRILTQDNAPLQESFSLKIVFQIYQVILTK